jgi:F-type H+-transporting ATPase subunit gamma
VGKKALEYFSAKGIATLTANYAEAATVTLGDCFTVAKNLCKRFLAGEFDRVCLCYTNFVSVLSQTPSCLQLLPLTRHETGQKGQGSRDILYEPDAQQVFAQIIPEYIGGLLYGALCESRASEQAARRMAMDSATQNADEMIAGLSLEFNRARQAAITQEITEIVAGV